MDNRLQTLIDYYEEEKQTIEKNIEECLQDADYLAAHQLSKALNETKNKLWIFNNLADKLYDEKEFLKVLIKRQESWAKSDTSHFMNAFYAERLANAKEKLEKLNQQKQKTDVNPFVFDQTLEKLVTKKIKSFNLILNKQKDFYFEFKIIKNKFRITIPNINKLLKTFDLFKYQIKKYKLLGFQFINNSNKMVLFLPSKTKEDTNQLKIILSKIVFEILQYGHGTSETYIVYKED